MVEYVRIQNQDHSVLVKLELVGYFVRQLLINVNLNLAKIMEHVNRLLINMFVFVEMVLWVKILK
jgi:hypothetical protein